MTSHRPRRAQAVSGPPFPHPTLQPQTTRVSKLPFGPSWTNHLPFVIVWQHQQPHATQDYSVGSNPYMVRQPVRFVDVRLVDRDPHRTLTFLPRPHPRLGLSDRRKGQLARERKLKRASGGGNAPLRRAFHRTSTGSGHAIVSIGR